MIKDPLELNFDQKKVLVERIKDYIREEMDEEIGDLKADLFLGFVISNIGKEYYNKGIYDAKNFFFKRMEDLEIDIDQILI